MPVSEQQLNLGALPRVSGLTITRAIVTPRGGEVHLVCSIVGEPKLVAAFKAAVDAMEAGPYKKWRSDELTTVITCRDGEKGQTAATAFLILVMQAVIQTVTASTAEVTQEPQGSRREPKLPYRRQRYRITQ